MLRASDGTIVELLVNLRCCGVQQKTTVAKAAPGVPVQQSKWKWRGGEEFHFGNVKREAAVYATVWKRRQLLDDEPLGRVEVGVANMRGVPTSYRLLSMPGCPEPSGELRLCCASSFRGGGQHAQEIASPPRVKNMTAALSSPSSPTAIAKVHERLLEAGKQKEQNRRSRIKAEKAVMFSPQLCTCGSRAPHVSGATCIKSTSEASLEERMETWEKKRRQRQAEQVVIVVVEEMVNQVEACTFQPAVNLNSVGKARPSASPSPVRACERLAEQAQSLVVSRKNQSQERSTGLFKPELNVRPSTTEQEALGPQVHERMDTWTEQRRQKQEAAREQQMPKFAPSVLKPSMKPSPKKAAERLSTPQDNEQQPISAGEEFPFAPVLSKGSASRGKARVSHRVPLRADVPALCAPDPHLREQEKAARAIDRAHAKAWYEAKKTMGRSEIDAEITRLENERKHARLIKEREALMAKIKQPEKSAAAKRIDMKIEATPRQGPIEIRLLERGKHKQEERVRKQEERVQAQITTPTKLPPSRLEEVTARLSPSIQHASASTTDGPNGYFRPDGKYELVEKARYAAAEKERQLQEELKLAHEKAMRSSFAKTAKIKGGTSPIAEVSPTSQNGSNPAHIQGASLPSSLQFSEALAEVRGSDKLDGLLDNTQADFQAAANEAEQAALRSSATSNPKLASEQEKLEQSRLAALLIAADTAAAAVEVEATTIEADLAEAAKSKVLGAKTHPAQQDEEARAAQVEQEEEQKKEELRLAQVQQRRLEQDEADAAEVEAEAEAAAAALVATGASEQQDEEAHMQVEQTGATEAETQRQLEQEKKQAEAARQRKLDEAASAAVLDDAVFGDLSALLDGFGGVESGEEEEAESAGDDEEGDVLADLGGVPPSPNNRGNDLTKRRYSVCLSPGDLDALTTVVPAEDQLNEDGDVDYVSVTCPEGVVAGQLLYVTTPDGRDIEVEVPDDIEAGMEFECFVGDVESLVDDELIDGKAGHLVSVTCPMGCAAGDTVDVQGPGGETVEVVVPEGVSGGDVFDAEI